MTRLSSNSSGMTIHCMDATSFKSIIRLFADAYCFCISFIFLSPLFFSFESCTTTASFAVCPMICDWSLLAINTHFCHSSSFSFFHSSEHRGPAQKRNPRRAGSVHLRLEHFLISLSSSWLLRNLFCRLYTLCKFQSRTQYALSVSSKRLICNLHVRDEDIADLWLCPI